LVVTGLIALVIWLAAPMTYARVAGLSVYGIAVLFTVLAMVRIRRGGAG